MPPVAPPLAAAGAPLPMRMSAAAGGLSVYVTLPSGPTILYCANAPHAAPPSNSATVATRSRRAGRAAAGDGARAGMRGFIVGMVRKERTVSQATASARLSGRRPAGDAEMAQHRIDAGGASAERLEAVERAAAAADLEDLAPVTATRVQ